MEIFIYCFFSAALALLVAYFLFSLRIKKLNQSISEATQSLRNIEKDFHLKEIDYLEEKRKYRAEINSQMEARLEEAKRLGTEIGEKSLVSRHKLEIDTLNLNHSERISKERAEAAKDAKEKAREELEQQVKLFSIKISPYAKITKDTGIIYNSHRAEVGYQYQLLVNGIPAFTPHLIIENSQDLSEVNEARIEALTQMAMDVAKEAATTYLNGAGKHAVHMTKAVIEQVGK